MIAYIFTIVLCVSVSVTAIAILFHFMIYPLFNKVSAFDFECYFKKYLEQVKSIIFPMLILDILLTLLLPFLPIPSKLISPLLVSLGMMALIYFNFFFNHIPLNLKLKEGQNPEVVAKLIRYNWISIISCIIRTLILIWILTQLHS